MKKRRRLLLLISVPVILLTALLYARRDTKVQITQYRSIARAASISPDYSATTIPPNIAPLNFVVQETGSHYYVKIHSKQGEPIEISGRSPKIIIPQSRWHNLLNLNRGEQLYFDIFIKTQNDQWNHFSTITNQIAHEPIDGFLVYRKMRPLYSTYREMGIYQRSLSNYHESLVLHGKYFGRGCVNCHTFLANRTDKMLMHVRAFTGPSMLLIQNGRASNIDSRTQFGPPMGHPAWHPSGKLITFTIYNVRQFFHTTTRQVRDVLDLDSALGYYVTESKSLKTNPEISSKDRLETFPTWSPDGRYLYFCTAPILWTDRTKFLPENYDQSKYDLVRISYDIETDTWGELETVLSAKQTGLSIVQPRISPDGKYLLFCMCNYSGFPTFQPSSDLYLMDLNNARFKRLACNSDQSESWHSWSSNNRWIVFSSKRPTGLFSKAFFSYVDPNGSVHRPFVLPQKDPEFYDSFIKLYQMPELVTQPVPVTGEALARLIRSSKDPTDVTPITAATPKAIPPALYGEPWQKLE
ncbi:MAG: PD40 domain-containing protein [Planctomycetota bacterium]|nr:MAG: PD40 domain-containing protein [Planctomycetota bacterium]